MQNEGLSAGDEISLAGNPLSEESLNTYIPQLEARGVRIGLEHITGAPPEKEWSQIFGGAHLDWGSSVHQTADGGFIVTGVTWSFGAGVSDLWLIKTDSEGDKEWSRTFGGAEEDWGFSVQQTDDGGFIVTGRTMSFGAGVSDLWLIKTDSAGNEQWSRTFGGAEEDWGRSVQQTDDGGFIVTGVTRSFGAGRSDLWLIKVAPEQPPIPIPPEPPSAIVVGHRVLPRDVAVGEEVTIGFTFTNTGNVAHTFGAGATLRRDGDDTTRIKFLTPVTLAPGESETVEWTHTIDTPGKWEVVFGVWQESTHPLESLIVETGWVDQYIIAIEAQERDYGLLWSFDTGKDVSSVSLSSDGAYIVAGSGREVILLNRKGKLLWSFQTAFPVTDVSISADASYIVVGTLRGGVIDDGWFYLLNREGELLGDFETTGISSVSISPCGSYWAITYQHGLGWWDRVTFFCRVEGSWLWVYTVGQSGTGAVSISADGKHIAVGSGAGAGDECEIRLYNKRGELLWRHEIPGRFLGREHSVSISADGRYIVAGDERGEEVLLLDYKGEIVWRYRTGIIEGVSISGDGSYVLAGSRNEIYLFSRDGEVLWNHPKDDLEDVSLSQDGSCIGVGSRSKVHLFVMDAPAIEPPSATIDSHTVSPRNITVGESVTIALTFTNTGNNTHTFGAGATLRRDGDDATRINFLEAVTVAPGETGSAQWTHTIDTAGKWEVVFGVWEESTHPLENLVVETGWVDEYITATDVLLEQGKPVLSAGLQIAPEKDTYFVGGVLTANFSVTNIGNKPITFDKLLVGGRFNYGELPEGGYPDFTMQQFVTVAPGEIHCYKGTLKLRHPGKYNFFVAFYIANPTPEERKLLDQHNWGSIELGEGVVGEATKQIMVRGFHPYPHGFSFDNDASYSGGWGPGCKMRIFINVYDLTGVDTRTQSEFFWRLNFGEGGNCFGMAVAELMEYRYPDRDYLVETELYNLYMQRDFIFYLSSDGFEEYIGNRTQWTAQGNIQERPLMKHIVGFQISWRGIDHARRIDGIQNVLNTLRNVNFSGASPEKYVIGIWDEGSGHALIPYKLVRVKENTYKLYVHDSNHPSPGLNSPGRTDQRITFERDWLGRWLWKYLMWTRVCGTEVWWSGRGETISLIPISLIHNEGRKLRIPGTGAEDGYIALCGEANLLLTDAEGRIAGIKDGEIFEEIPGVQLVFPMGAIPEKEPARWAPTFYLSDEVADIDLTFTVQGITYEEEPFSLIRFGPGYFVEFDSKIEPGAKSEIQILERGTKVIISDHNREYDLVLNKNDNGISRTFTVTDIAVSDEAKHQFTIAWDAFIREEEAVTLKIDADGDGVFEKQRTLQPPVASFAYSPEEMIAGQPITFDASGSSDPDGEIMSYEWDFGDGTSGTGKVVEHTFALAGDYTVTLTIADNDGVVSSFSKMVTVAEAAVDPPAPAVDPPDPAVDPPDPAVDPPVPAVDPPARLNWGIIGGIAVAVVVVGLGILFLVKRRRVAQQE
ncbi:PKD domain-containing protein [Dehalococcoidia bacterium]|nr:PKD domain-containing protein [Dehalococcoidia bacterium]